MPIARLEATIRNALGGKPKASDKGNISVDSLWTGEELLPDYALPMAIRQTLEGRKIVEPPSWMTVEVARGMEKAINLGMVGHGAWLELGKVYFAAVTLLDRIEGKM